MKRFGWCVWPFTLLNLSNQIQHCVWICIYPTSNHFLLYRQNNIFGVCTGNTYRHVHNMVFYNMLYVQTHTKVNWMRWQISMTAECECVAREIQNCKFYTEGELIKYCHWSCFKKIYILKGAIHNFSYC